MRLNLNFASRRYVNRRAINRAYWLISICLLFLLVWFIAQCLIINDHILQNESQLAALLQDEQELLGTTSVPFDSARLDEIRREIARDQHLLDQDSFRWTALFDRMELLLPEGVSLRGFSPDYSERTLAIEGVAKNLDRLQEFLDKLLESESISNAYINRHASVKVRDIKGKEYPALSFSINLEGVF